MNNNDNKMYSVIIKKKKINRMVDYHITNVFFNFIWKFACEDLECNKILAAFYNNIIIGSSYRSNFREASAE